MTTLFLLLSMLFAWLAWNLYHPIHRHGGLNVLSFLCGWLTGELVLHHITWQVIVACLFIGAGAVHGLGGIAGFVLCIGAWLAMGNFHLSGYEARDRAALALSSGLGDDYESQIPEVVRRRFPAGPDYRKIILPIRNLDPRVERIRDISYDHHGQTLDIFRRRDAPPDCPVLMQIHGGAWTEKMGSKDHQAIPLMSHMALHGWIAVAISYRLSPKATFPEHLIDCKRALVWIRENIHEFGGNPDFIAVTGGSAGGHLCSLMGLTQNRDEFQPGFEEKDTSVRGVVSFYGVYDFIDEHKVWKNQSRKSFLEASIMKKPMEDNMDDFKAASPLFQIDAGAPPFMIVHGDKDTLIPVEEARVFAKELSAISHNPVVYVEIPGAQHAFDMFPSVRSEYVKLGVERFLAWLRGSSASSC